MDHFMNIMKELEGKADKSFDEYVELEVVTTFEVSEFLGFPNFEVFFDQVDVNNGYEEDWPEHLENGIEENYRRVYTKLLNELREL